MATKFIQSNRKQAYLLPPSVDEWLPKDHLARYIVEIADQLDLESIYKEYNGNSGKEAYDPKVLLSLLFYGYATGTFSSCCASSFFRTIAYLSERSTRCLFAR